MSTRTVLRGPHKGKLATVVGTDHVHGLLYCRVAAAVGDPAPGQFEYKIPQHAFTASWLSPETI